MDCFHQLLFEFKYGFLPTNDNQDGRQNGRPLSVSIHHGYSYLVTFNWISSKFHIWFASIKVIQDPCEKITECFFLKKRVIFICCLKTYKYWRSQKNHLSTHLYDQIYFDPLVQFHPSMRSELYLVRQFWSEKLIFTRIQCMYY